VGKRPQLDRAVAPGALLTLSVEKPVAGGRMIARHNGAVVLVSGAIPGEVIEARVEKLQRGTVWARTERVLDPSSDRVDAGDSGACGGAVFAHLRYERQLQLKRDILNDAFTRIGKMSLPDVVTVAASPREGYRMRARLHVQRGRIGFFREGTHALCDPASTGQLTPATVETVRALEATLAAHEPHAITDVEVSENVAATTRAVHFELAGVADPSDLQWLVQPANVSGLSAAQAGGFHTITLSGSPFVTDSLTIPAPGGDVRYDLTRHAHAFFQGNRFLLVDLVRGVLDRVAPGSVLDLYAGVGLFSIAVAALGGEVVAVEGDRRSADDLQQNAAASGRAIDARHQAVETFLEVEPRRAWSTVIVDPPRTGMSREALTGTLALGAERVVYVSCDVATLARDARQLVDAGYALASVEAFDLFPDTAHVETLALFAR
jgi:23S rRNA (uracil1939-C5)-methyltransferase